MRSELEVKVGKETEIRQLKVNIVKTQLEELQFFPFFESVG